METQGTASLSPLIASPCLFEVVLHTLTELCSLQYFPLAHQEGNILRNSPSPPKTLQVVKNVLTVLANSSNRSSLLRVRH